MKSLCFLALALALAATIWAIIGLGTFKAISLYARIALMQETGALIDNAPELE